MQPSWLCQVVLASLVAGQGEPQPSATCRHHALKRTRWKFLVGSWPCALKKELPTALQVGYPRSGVPRTLLVSDARHHPLPSECCAPDGCSQDLYAFRLPRLWTELIHVRRWNSSFCSKPWSSPDGAECQTLATSTLRACRELLSPVEGRKAHIRRPRKRTTAPLAGGSCGPPPKRLESRSRTRAA